MGHFLLNSHRFGVASAFPNALSTDFDGSNEYAKGGNNLNIGSSDFTVSCWVKADTVLGPRGIVTKGTLGANAGYAINISNVGPNPKLSCQVRDSSNNIRSAGADTTVSTGQWYHTVMTAELSSSTGLKFYLDGIAESTTGNLSTLGATLDSVKEFCIGARHSGNFDLEFDGHIDEVTVWLGAAFSAAEVTELYNSGSPADPTTHSQSGNLTAWYRMGDGDTFSTITDNVGSVDLAMVNMESGDFTADVP